MRYYLVPSSDPAFCLALEEYFLSSYDFKDGDGGIMLLWKSSPSIIIGKFQNAYEEVSPLNCMRHNICIYRRNTGGGAVYHDMGNLNFSFIKRYTEQPGYNDFLSPVASMLSSLGIDAEVRDTMILSEGKKISGNAEAFSGGKVLHHGTLLVNADLGELSLLTGHRRDIIRSKAIKSNPYPVKNIGKADITTEELKYSFIKQFAQEGEFLPDEDMFHEVSTLANSKYDTWEWNWGRSPAFCLENDHVFIEARNGITEHAAIFGDETEALKGQKLTIEGYKDILSDLYDPRIAEIILSEIFE